MRIKKILTIYKKEIRSITRDKKSLRMMLLMPFIIPVMVFAMSYLYDAILNDVSTDSYFVGINYEIDEYQSNLFKELNLDILTYTTKDEMQKAYDNKDISAYVEKIDNNYTIYYNKNDSTNSCIAFEYLYNYLESYNNYLGQVSLASMGINPTSVYNMININYDDSLTGDNYMLATIISMALSYAFMSVILSASTSANDSISGEKEKGTLETMLTFPLKSSEIVAGKYLAVFTSSFISAVLACFLSYVSIMISSQTFSVYDGVTLNLSATSLILLFVSFVFASFIGSGLAIAISGFCKNYKEAQAALQSLSFVAIAPMFVSLLGVPTNFLISIIPIIGEGVIVNDIINAHISIPNISFMIISSLIYSIIIVIFVANQYKKEKTLFS